MSERHPETEGPETEQPESPDPDLDPARTGQEFGEPERTGVEEVDDVLASLGGLDDRPVDEHPSVFEHAHERLRQALDRPTGI
jgi:hypothetical protein